MAQRIRTHILDFPYAESLLYAHLDRLAEEVHGQRHDLIVDYRELQMCAPPTLMSFNGRLGERIQGTYVPRQLRFMDVRDLRRDGAYAHLADLPADHGVRSLCGVLTWRQSHQAPFYVFDDAAPQPSTLMFFARHYEQRPGTGTESTIEVVRDWSPPPPLRPCLVPNPLQMHWRYGGDAVTVHVQGNPYPRLLFVGGLDCQAEQRPEVAAVLNVSEEPSRWLKTSKFPATDRWMTRGEGRLGMTVAEIQAEADWVIERLQLKQRVLVHCSAGLNRSVTVVCAVLILLEGLSAEAALMRVRLHHPWARPDTHHWLALKGLAAQIVAE